MERIVLAVSGLACAGLIGFMVYTSMNDPTVERKASLERELRNISPEYIEYQTGNQADFARIWDVVQKKPNLWRELIPPPPPPKVIPKIIPPDWSKILKDVQISKISLGRGDTMKARIKHPGSPRGEFLGVGDRIGVAEIKNVDSDKVLFETKKDDRVYTHAVARK